MDHAQHVGTNTSRHFIGTVVCDHKIQNASVSCLMRNTRLCGSETYVLIGTIYDVVGIGDIN